MKKLILSIAIIISALSFTHAQVKLGLKVGASLSTLNTEQLSDINRGVEFDYRTSYQVGMFTQFKLIEKISLQPELLWQNKGGKLSGEGTLRVNAIHLPILLNYQLVKGLNLLIGPDVSLVMNTKYKNDNGFVGNVNDALRSKVDIGVNLGMAYQLTKDIGLGFRYHQGLTNRFDFSLLPVEDPNPPKYTNRLFQLYVSYSLIN